MNKIVRERYEAGVLVSREVEAEGMRWDEIAKLVIQAIAALSLAVIAIVTVSDSLLAQYEQSNEATAVNVSCPKPPARKTM